MVEMSGDSIDNITSEIVARAARKGDPLACSVIEKAADYLGIGLANVVNIFNPDVIVIGGGVSKMGELLLKPTRASMKMHAFTLPACTVKVIKSRLGTNAGILGAAVYAHRKWSEI
jgi:glucokinase